MDDAADGDVAWTRRPRRAARGIRASGLFWLFASFFLGVAVLAGLGTVLSEEAWWARALGASVAMVAGAGAAVLALHYRRPIGDFSASDAAEASRAAAAYGEVLEGRGRVELSLRPAAVLTTSVQGIVMLAFGVGGILMGGFLGYALGAVTCLLAVFLGILPHLEFVTGIRPVVCADARGIHIARWTPLMIPWDEVVSARLHRATGSQANVVIHVGQDFFGHYLAKRPAVLRVYDRMFAALTGCAFTIPSTVEADQEALAQWLDQEADRRRRQAAAGSTG